MRLVWYIWYLVFIIVGTYYINILVNVVLVLSTAIVKDGQDYKTIQGSFVNKYINSKGAFGSMNVQDVALT